jgi:hypothetical protein
LPPVGLNPVAYLSDIVPTLARGIERDDIAALMPNNLLLADYLGRSVTQTRSFQTMSCW